MKKVLVVSLLMFFSLSLVSEARNVYDYKNRKTLVDTTLRGQKRAKALKKQGIEMPTAAAAAKIDYNQKNQFGINITEPMKSNYYQDRKKSEQ